eukprot:evm.model.NODE_50951_length_58533_cov_30.382143.16
MTLPYKKGPRNNSCRAPVLLMLRTVAWFCASPRPISVKKDVKAKGATMAKEEACDDREKRGQHSRKMGPHPTCMSLRAVVEAQILRVARSLTPSE